MSDDLEEAARERAELVREKRRDRADPEGRVQRVQEVRDQDATPDDLDLPEPAADGDAELPNALGGELEEVRKKLTYGLREEYGFDLDPDEQFYPLVVHLGVERLKGMWLEEVRRTLETTEGIESPGEE